MRERVKTRNTKYGKKLNKRLMPNWKREIQDTIEKEKRTTNSKRKAAQTVSEDINDVPKKVVKT